MSTAFTSMLFILVAAVNVMWYVIKSTLFDHGYKVNFLFGHFRDLSNMTNLIRKTDDPDKRRKYKWMLGSLVIGLVLAVSFFVIQLMSI